MSAGATFVTFLRHLRSGPHLPEEASSRRQLPTKRGPIPKDRAPPVSPDDDLPRDYLPRKITRCCWLSPARRTRTKYTPAGTRVPASSVPFQVAV
jgi:hypothetical protein